MLRCFFVSVALKSRKMAARKLTSITPTRPIPTTIITITPTTAVIRPLRHFKTAATIRRTIDNKTYNKVTIGTQTWMAQNLNYNATGSVCYNNSADSCAKYGRLYNWTDALTACPSGWYLPSDAEWTVLTGFVGGATAAARRTCFRFVVCRTDYNVSSKQRFSGGLCSLELVMTNRVSRD